MRNIYLFLIYSTGSYLTFAQQSPSTTVLSKDYNTPTSLGASNFSSNSPVAVGVDHFTGRVQLNVPLGSAGDAFTQVSINYSSGGFKPSTPSTTLGLGWNLSCGGAISRQVRGIPDEISKLWQDEVNSDIIKEVSQELNEDRILNFNEESPHFKLGTTDHWEPGEDRYVEFMANGKFDTQFDLFSISAPGISGTFMLTIGNQTLSQSSRKIPEIKFFGPSSLEIIPNWDIGYVSHEPGYTGPNPLVVLGVTSFLVKAPDGSTYFFSKKVTCKSHVLVAQSGVNYKRTLNDNDDPVLIEEIIETKPDERIDNDPYTSAWLLEKVETPLGQIITFDYDIDVFKCKSLKRQKISNPELLIGNEDEFFGYYPKDVSTGYTYVQEVTGYRLTKISSKSGLVLLDYNKKIKNPQSNQAVLTGINFYQFGKFSGGVQFSFGYLLKDGGTWSLTQSGEVPPITRLVLTQLSFFDQFGNSPGATKFKYFDGLGLIQGGFPEFDNLRVDHWGFISNVPSSDDYFTDYNRRNEGRVNSLSNRRKGLIWQIEKPDGTIFSIDYDHNYSLENLRTSFFSQEISGGLKVVKISRKSVIENEPERSREFLYGRKEYPFSFDYMSNTWLGGFPIYSQKNADPLFENNHNITYQKSCFQGVMLPYLDDGYLKMPRYLRKYKMVQSTPVYQLEDELGRSVVYTRVLEKSESDEYLLYEFKDPEFVSNGQSRITSGFRRPLPPSPPSLPQIILNWLSGSFNFNVLSNSVLQILEGQQSKLYNGNLTSFSNINALPDEISKFENYSNRFSFSRQLDIFKPGGQPLKISYFNREKTLMSINETEYLFLSRNSLKSILINGLINFQVAFPGEKGSQIFNSVSNAVKNFYLGEYYPTASNLLGISNQFIFRAYEETIGGYLPIKTTQTSFDRKIAGSGSIEIVQEHTLITDASNPRLFGKPRSSYEKKVSKMNGQNDQVLSESWVQLRYPSDFLTTGEREHLETAVYSNSAYLAGLNANRNDFALAHLTHRIQDEGPMETYSYSKNGASGWFLTKAEISIPYGWGNQASPLLSSRFQFAFPIKTKIGKDATTHLPVGFSPMDWSISGSFSIDPGYEKTMEILEVSADGAVLSSVPLVKKPGTNTYLKGEINSQILGYKRSMPVVEIAMAKGSECAYTSFEMPIVNSSDENWWAVYNFPKENENVNYTDIVNEGFTGGKSARVNYSFGPTYSLPLNSSTVKDYVFEAWVKQAENSGLQAKGKLVAYLHRGSNMTPILVPVLEGATFTAGSEWTQVRVKISLASDTIPSGSDPLFLRLYSESLKSGPSSPSNLQGFLIDECRVYPADALIKSQALDMETGNLYGVDTKGKMISTKIKDGVISHYGTMGELKSFSKFTLAK